MTADQLTLFEGPRPATEQEKHLERVRSKIEISILEFLDGVGEGGTFHMLDLTRHVLRQIPSTAPDSPSRILRLLKRQGDADYEVVNRRDSLYRILP